MQQLPTNYNEQLKKTRFQLINFCTRQIHENEIKQLHSTRRGKLKLENLTKHRNVIIFHQILFLVLWLPTHTTSGVLRIERLAICSYSNKMSPPWNTEVKI